MKIKSLKKKHNNQYQIILSDNNSLSFYDDTIINFNLLTNKEISKEYLIKINEYNNKILFYNKALNFITYKLRTKNEIITKLKRLNADGSTIEYVIKRLEKEGYINNKLYLKSYINDQIKLTLKGPKKISNELIHLGFKINEIDELLLAIPDNIWLEKIERIITKKVNSNHNLSQKMLEQKIKSYLLTQGYDISLLNNVSINKDNSKEKDTLKKEYNKEYKKLSLKYEGNILLSKLKYNLYKKGFSTSSIEDLINNQNQG